MKILEMRLRPVQVRMGLNRFLSDALLGLCIGWAAAAAALLLDKLLYLPAPLGWLPWAATVAPLAGAALGAWLRRAGPREAAILVDARLALAERLSSALLVSGETPMEAAVRADAERHLSRLAPAVACPVAWPRRRLWGALLALAALGLAVSAPRWDLLQRGSKAKARELGLAEVKNAGAQLEKRVQKLVEGARKQGVETGEIGKGLEQLTAELKEGIQDPKEALARVNDLQDRLKAEMDSCKDREKAALARDLQKAMQALTREDGKAPAGAQADSLKDMIQDLRELAQKAAAGNASPAEIAEMQKTLSSLAESLRKTEATRELASELSRAAQAMERQKGALPEMGDNLKNLAEQLGRMDKALDKEQVMEMAKADLESLKQQLSGQSPWQAPPISPEDQAAFEEKLKQMAQNDDPSQQPGGS